MTEPTEKQASLYSKHGGADKVYNVFLRARGDGWSVDYSHGGRGKTMTTGTKTETPIPYDKALKKFNALIAEKKNGSSHYIEGESAGEYTSPNDAKALFGMFPQEPMPITRKRAMALAKEPHWGFQQKANGENRLLRIDNGKVIGGNKKGQIVPVLKLWTDTFGQLGNVVLNGEQVGDDFLAFDLLELDGQDRRSWRQCDRYQLLLQYLKGKESIAPNLKVLHCVYEETEKLELLAELEETLQEGIVAKWAFASYEVGKGEDTLKFQFREISTFIVLGHNAQRSVQIGALGETGEVVAMGNCPIPSNRPIPEVGSLNDVQYLYYNPGGGLDQPVYDPGGISPRKDVDRKDCTLSQITRLKPVAGEPEQAALQAETA